MELLRQILLGEVVHLDIFIWLSSFLIPCYKLMDDIAVLMIKKGQRNNHMTTRETDGNLSFRLIYAVGIKCC